jgi:hypothetical protein
MKYRKKPVVIEAIQFTGGEISEDAIADFMDQNIRVIGRKYIEIDTLEGTMTADLNDYIIKGIAGEFYPCKPDIFEQTYEPVNE